MMKEEELAIFQANIFNDRERLIKEVSESWKIEVLEIDEKQIKTFDEHWLRDVNFRFSDALIFDELFEFNSLEVDKEKFYGILKKLDPNLFMVIEKVIIINNKDEYLKLVDKHGGFSLSNEYPGINVMGEFVFTESYIILYMEAIRKVVEDECEIWPYYNKKAELNRAFWLTLLHELRHTMQENPLYENEYESMTREEKERDAEDYCREVFNDIIMHYNYYVIK